MAKAAVFEEKPVKPVRKVVLTLDLDEAKTLREVMARIGGCPTFSRRVHTDAIRDALRDAGVHRPAAKFAVGNQSIHFAEEKNFNDAI